MCGAVGALLFSSAAAAQVQLVSAGQIVTGDPQQVQVQAMVVDADSGRVLALGQREPLQAQYPQASLLDLGTATIVPGLIDAHAHLVNLGHILSEANLWGVDSKAEVIARLQAAEKTLAPGQWLIGRGWDQNLWPEKAFPTAADLDAAFPERPVYLDRVDGHAAWVNSAALRLAQQQGRSLAGDWQPEGGRIERDAKGQPSGVLVDAASALVAAHIPAHAPAELDRRLGQALAVAVANGLTGVHDMGVSRDELARFARFADAGKLPLRIDAYADGDGQALADLCANGLYRHAGGRLQMRGVKLFVDGALGSRGAAMLAPYSDDPHNHGLLMMTPDEHLAASRKAAACGVQVASHAIGDRGNRLVLDNYQSVLAGHTGQDLRWRVEHAQVLAEADIARFGQLGVIASMQPTHATSDMGWAQDRVGAERIKGAYAWQRLADSGAHLALGSDFPVEQVDPRLGLQAAVTRQDGQGLPAGGWYADQRLSPAQALAGFTSGAAYAGFGELEVGMLRQGLRADFVVLDGNPLQVDGKALSQLKVLATWVDGVPVYQAE
ncbi:amidohydrolase [Stenotrophomonas ginsengisoli]|uniref:Amidohydrolase n=1 Tax=Stenotrophomonas ginsengisoli TaxID=336566 RepID=A0A0R0D6Y6_9GAMM|nr:amidohydrolase [Stenotrophomonas ginsengisoli]KRG77312.1 amidohydrolase [Stenotrophomonas ginsengisoli]